MLKYDQANKRRLINLRGNEEKNTKETEDWNRTGEEQERKIGSVQLGLLWLIIFCFCTWPL